MFRSENKKNGLTLIEIIVVLVVLGIIGSIIGMGIANIAKSYVASGKSLDTAQKGTLVLTRLSKELSVVKSISSGTASAITYTGVDSPNLPYPHTISINGANLLLNNADILTDQVSAFTLSYCDVYNSAAPCPNVYSATTTIINVNLVLIPQTGMTTSFTDRIYIIRPYNK
jgi:prepilin-type N-terminal cleavage/methylation domain-containing protein